MKNNETMEDLLTISLKRTKIRNEFKEQMKESYINTSIDVFETTCSSYERHYSEIYPEKTENDKKESLITLIGQSMLEFIHTSHFNENKIADYVSILGCQLDPVCLAFLLWTQGKREATFSVFKNHEININDEIYESMLTLFKPHTYHLRSIDHNNIEENIEKQKQEFFYYQKNYVLLEELRKLPTKDDTTKKIKI